MEKRIMSPRKAKDSLAILDLTDSKNGIHAINIVVEKIKKALERKYEETDIVELRSDPIVSVKENYDDLLIPDDNLGRSSRYTRYVSRDTILRTHTSAILPRWLKEEARKEIKDKTVVLPGICYRRDVVDKTHCGEPHQMDVWRIKKGDPRLSRNNLIHLIEVILESTIPGKTYRANETNHPYTINGIEVEILVNGEWLEVLECGEVHPQIIINAGLDPKDYSGLALGMGLDRIAMIIKEIDDIRVLRSEDPRIKKQMKNLEKYVPVSDQPPTKRVLSYSASNDKTEEDICEEVIAALGEKSVYIEEIHYSEVLYQDLPEKAKERLGILPSQKNIVVTLTFRSLEGTLERKRVNDWMQILYPKLNEGQKGYM
jgi:phenylalanyl-tRNA synthetase alpha chain